MTLCILQLFWRHALGTTSCPPRTRQYINLSSTVSVILGKCFRIVPNTKQIIDLRTPCTDACEGLANWSSRLQHLPSICHWQLPPSHPRKATYTRPRGRVPIPTKSIPVPYDTEKHHFVPKLCAFYDLPELHKAVYFVVQIKLLRI